MIKSSFYNYSKPPPSQGIHNNVTIAEDEEITSGKFTM